MRNKNPEKRRIDSQQLTGEHVRLCFQVIKAGYWLQVIKVICIQFFHFYTSEPIDSKKKKKVMCYPVRYLIADIYTLYGQITQS